MPFILIKDYFKPTVGIPDGDSARFRANSPTLLKKLDGTPVHLGTSDKSESIAQAPSLENIEAIKTTTSKMNWLLTPFLIPKQERESSKMHHGENTKRFLTPFAIPLAVLNQPLESSYSLRSTPCG